MKKRNSDDLEFGKRLKELRLQRKLSAEEVARLSGVATSTYRDWEAGRAVSGQPYIKLANCLGTTVYKLLGLEEQTHAKVFKALSEIELIAVDAKSHL